MTKVTKDPYVPLSANTKIKINIPILHSAQNAFDWAPFTTQALYLKGGVIASNSSFEKQR